MPARVTVVGSSNTDMIIQVERIPRPGETILGGRFSMAAGGKGANQAVAAARAGASVTFVARVGQDMFGEQALRGFEQDGIDVSHIVRDATAPSGVALIFVDEQGENSIAVASGANANLSPADVERAGEAIRQADVLLMQLETPLETVAAAAELAAVNGVRVILNPAPARPLPDELLQRVTILTPNESEAELLTGIPVQGPEQAEQAALQLRDRGVQAIVVTLGAQGALIVTDRTRQLVPGFAVQAVDTTAAGDVFNGALTVALAEGCPLEEAARFGSAAAAISVTRLGAQPSVPRRAEIEDFLRERAAG